MKFWVPPIVPAFVVPAVMAVASCGVAWADDAPSYTLKDVTACSADAMRLCRDRLPDITKIESCMKENYENLRPKCKARFKDR